MPEANDLEPLDLEVIGDEESDEAAEELDQEYTEDELEGFARDVESLMSDCALAQPYDEGEVVWLNSHSSLNDVMIDADVPEECREEVAELVSCPYCGDHHDIWDEVGVKSQGELRYEALMNEWFAKDANQLDEFYGFLTKYPYLGAAHDFGKKLRDGIATFPSTTLTDQVFYRARRITSGKPYTLADFMPPDPAKHSVGEGRYNHAGQSVMYMADGKDGAAIECVADAEDRAWVHAFRIRQVDKILDLSDEEAWANEDMPALACGLMHTGAVREFSDRTSSWKPEYFVPRFIADCARENGFNGILFKSVRHSQSNLVLFTYDATNIIAEGNPEIIQIADWKRTDWKYKGPDLMGEIDLPNLDIKL